MAAPTDWRSMPRQNIRLAANKHRRTDPDVTAVTVRLRTLRSAVDRTIRNLSGVGGACFLRLPWDFDRFFFVMEFTVEGSGRWGLTLTLPVEVDLRSCAIVARPVRETLKSRGER